jgi:hypothetical protein
VNPIKQRCPSCNVTLTRYEWSRLWFLASGMSGRLVQPCAACGTLLRLSAMRMFTALGAVGLIASSILRAMTETELPLFLALLCAVLILVGMIGTRVEAVRQIAAQ